MTGMKIKFKTVFQRKGKKSETKYERHEDNQVKTWNKLNHVATIVHWLDQVETEGKRAYMALKMITTR